MLLIDVITAALLAVFWNVTININGHAWHVPLIVLAFIGGVRLRVWGIVLFTLALKNRTLVTRYFTGDGLHVHGNILSNGVLVICRR